MGRLVREEQRFVEEVTGGFSMRSTWAIVLAFAGAATAAPVPTPEPRLEWIWSELDEPLIGHPTVVFSTDGKFLAAAAHDRIGVWSIETKKQISRMQLAKPDHVINLAFTADGKQVISDCRSENQIRFWDVKTGKQVRELEIKQRVENGENRFKAFSPGGEFVVDQPSGRGDTYLNLIDLKAGEVRPFAKDGRDFDAWAEVAFSPDGKTLAYNGPRNRLRIFETATGKMVRELRPPHDNTGWNRSHVRYSPDGRYLMAGEFGYRNSPFDKHRFVIWGVEDGMRYSERIDRGGWIGAGNRYLVEDVRSVYDLLTDESVPIGKRPVERAGEDRFPPRRILCGMSPDGGTLVFHDTPSTDPNMQTSKRALYITPAPILPPPIRVGVALSDEETKKVWSGISADNLFRRNHCIRVLSAQPELAVQIAQTKLKPVPAADAERLKKLIAELDDDSADVRDKAQAELQEIGRRFETTIVAALKTAPPGEVRNRLTVVSRKIAEVGPSAELIADIRAVAFLKALNTPAALDHLKAVAAGAEGARLTAEAATAISR
jgi:hypothetical protein